MCGLTIAGAALLEVALVPGILLGGAVVLAPEYLPKLRRHPRPVFNPSRVGTPTPAVPMTRPLHLRRPPALAPFKIKQAVGKTITFRIIVTTLDFTWNYLVIGEVATSAGLSAFSLIAGPLFYLAHEMTWNYFDSLETDVAGPVLPSQRAAKARSNRERGISGALAKTITFRTIATVMDFTANYIVVGDLVTATVLSAFGFVVGPFIYLGHEKAWEHLGRPSERNLDAVNLPRFRGELPVPHGHGPTQIHNFIRSFRSKLRHRRPFRACGQRLSFHARCGFRPTGS
jgi:uncharacterized membrane protein